jgi:uncharacterized integral membrane protein (TIGR00698 family)
MKQLKRIDVAGAGIAVLVGVLSYLAASIIGGLSAVMMALFIGILLGNIGKLPKKISPGISWSSSNLLELSIIFLGFEVSFQHISKLGSTAFLGIAFMIVLLLIATKWLSKRLRCPGQTALLIGFGTAICGSSAIAAAAPRIAADKSDAGIAIAVVNFIGALGMIVLPAALPLILESQLKLGFFTGASLHAVGNVAGAAFAMSDESGEYALTVKLARVALLSPALIIYGFILREQKEGEGPWYKQLALPLYLWLFIAASVISSLNWLPDSWLNTFHTIGKILLSAAMFAIGLKLSVKKLYSEGRNAIGFGLIIFAVQLVIVSVLMWFF